MRKIWSQKNLLSPVEVDVHRVAAIGKQMNLDTVLTCFIEVGPGEQQDTIEVFLVDVHTRKVYHQVGYTHVFWNDGKIKLRQLIDRAISAYKREKAKT